MASCEGETERMAGYEVHGVDVSRYQGDIDWDLVQNEEVHFAFVKASEGNTFRDTFFQRNWEALGQKEIRRGAYHFFRPEVTAIEQAKNFISLVKLDKGDLPPALDIEVMGNISKSELVTAAKSWLQMIESKYGLKPIVYTNMKFYNEYLAGNFDDYYLWIARYNSTLPPRLSGGKQWDFWQYGNRGKLDGINHDVDFNVFRGGLLELEIMTEKETTNLSINDEW